MRLEKYKEAITKFKKGLQVKEELNEEIYLNSQIGFCYRLLGSEKTALKYHLKAKELGRMMLGLIQKLVYVIKILISMKKLLNTIY